MDVLDHKCPGCGAMLPFNPATQKWDCQYCGTSYTLEQLTEFEAKQQKAYQENTKSEETMSADLYKCPNCGAEVITDENTSATFCVYCGSTNIIKDRLVKGLKPTYIIPFKKTKEQALDAFRIFRKGKIFAPKDFSNPENIKKITGVYIPFWLYDAHTSGTATFNATKVKHWRSGDYNYTQTDRYSVIRSGQMDFQKVPVDGSTKFDDNTMDSIEPFKYEELKPFNMSYLSGFLSEKYDVGQEEAYNRAKLRMDNSTVDEFKSTVLGYSSVTLESEAIEIRENNAQYVLLPVWMLNITYKDNVYLFALNGQTGKMVGDIPIDKKKRLLYGTLCFFASFLVCTLISMILSIM